MTETMKSWLEITFFNNTLKDYALACVSLVTLVIVLILCKRLLVRHLGKLAAKTVNDFDDLLVNLLGQVGAPVLIVTSLYFATLPLHLGSHARLMIRYTLVIVVTVRLVLTLQEIVRYIIGKFYLRARPNDPAAGNVVKNLTNIVSWAIWALGVVFALDNFGINISTLVAGLGIGGVAVALAAQAVLDDLFSALSIFVDKPFEVGDFIIVDGLMGTVEYVGMKTTRIRSLSGEELVFSNSDLTKSRIKNYKRMESRRVVFKIGVTYGTSLEKLKEIPLIIADIVRSMKDVRLDRSHFESFGDFCLSFETVYFVLSADYNLFMDRQQQINFAIKEAFEKRKIEFAYPTQTLYLQKNVM